MATHNYVVTSASYFPGSSADPGVTIIGTVDTNPVTVTIGLSALVAANNSGGIAAVKNLVSPIMLAQMLLLFPPAATAVTQLPTGSWTQ